MTISASNPIKSFYVTFATREMLTTEVPESSIHEGTSTIAIQNSDVGISFGLNKVSAMRCGYYAHVHDHVIKDSIAAYGSHN